MILDLRETREIPDLKKLFTQSPTCLLLWKIPDTLPVPATAFLTAEELAHWQSQTNPERQRQFLASRYYTKTTLARFLATTPASFGFDSRGEGKLCLPPALSSRAIDFNFSHTDQLFFLGVSLAGEIGVDLEAKTPKKNSAQIAERVFSLDERQWVGSSTDRFFRLWSLKEAVIKAAGGGVFRHVQDIEFLAQGENLKLQKLPGDFGALGLWQTFENPLPDFACAWAIKARA